MLPVTLRRSPQGRLAPCRISARSPLPSRPPTIKPAHRLPSLSPLAHSSRRVLYTSSPLCCLPAASSATRRAGRVPDKMQKVHQLTGSADPKLQVRNHSHHSHGLGHHHHHHDNTYLTSSNKNDAGVRVTRLGLYVNLGMAVGKGVGGYVFNSQALVADAFHALTDLVSDFMTLATISVALKPPTAQYPNGFGKAESFGSLVVSGLLLTGGILMAVHSGGNLLQQLLGDSIHLTHHAHEAAGHSHGILGHSHSHSAKDMIPNLNAAWIAGGSIIIKEYLYRITMKIARERKSSVLASNAVHHRVDSLTSIVALVAIGGSHLIHGATWLDPVGGLLVALMVIQAGFGNTMSSIYELCDASMDEEVRSSVARAVGKALQSKVVELRNVQGVKAGQNYLLDIELAVPLDCPMSTMREVEDRVREKVGSSVRGARRVRIRFVPRTQTAGDFADEFIGADVSPRESPEPESHHHDHEHEHEHEHEHDIHAHKSTSSSIGAKGAAEKRH